MSAISLKSEVTTTGHPDAEGAVFGSLRRRDLSSQFREHLLAGETRMDEQEFDALFPSRPFGTKDAIEEDARWRRCATLGALLFGTTPDDLRRQLLAPHPEIPPGHDLADFHDLERQLEMVCNALSNVRITSLSPVASVVAATIVVGTERFSLLEARREIVRRAIHYLENY